MNFDFYIIFTKTQTNFNAMHKQKKVALIRHFLRKLSKINNKHIFTHQAPSGFSQSALYNKQREPLIGQHSACP